MTNHSDTPPLNFKSGEWGNHPEVFCFCCKIAVLKYFSK